MTRNRAQFILGLLIALMPALGFPHSWTYTFIILMAFGVAGIAMWNYLDKRTSVAVQQKKSQTFTENAGQIISDKQ